MHRILIVGGGFGGVTAARRLANKHLKDVEVTLIADEPWIEYYGVLYRLIRGESPSQACIPLKMVLPESVTVVLDRAASVDPQGKTVKTLSGKTLPYDTLVLAPGAEASYFGIPGMKENALSMSNVHAALQLREKVQRAIAALQTAPATERDSVGRFAVIGGGATGVEVSGELLAYGRILAREERLDPKLIHVDLVEGADRLLPQTEPKTSARVRKRLRDIGVDIHLNATVESVGGGAVRLKGGETIFASSVVWTAGVKASSLLESVPGLELDRKGRAVVDEHLRARGVQNIFVLGDSAATPFTGMAQTAFKDGVFVARVIAAERRGRTPPSYKPSVPAYAIPAGQGWAAVKFGPIRAFGFAGYILRRLADIHVYMLLMHWRFIRAAFFAKIPLEKYGITLGSES